MTNATFGQKLLEQRSGMPVMEKTQKPSGNHCKAHVIAKPGCKLKSLIFHNNKRTSAS